MLVVSVSSPLGQAVAQEAQTRGTSDRAAGREWVVTIRVKRDYVQDTSAFKYALSVSRALPPTQAYLTKTDGSLSGLVSRLYALGPSISQRYTALLLDEIRQRNGIADDRLVQEGPLRIPTLPRYRPGIELSENKKGFGYNPSLPKNSVPVDFVFTGSGFSAERYLGKIDIGSIDSRKYTDDQWLQVLQDPSRKGPEDIYYTFATADTALLRLASQGGPQYDGPLDVLVTPGDLASGPESEASLHADVQDSATLQIVAEASRRVSARGLVVVLDINWPDSVKANASASWFAAAINRWRTRMGQTCSVPQREVKVSESASRTHAAAIARSVASFETAVVPSPVDVHYLPMLPSPGTDSLLVDLLDTYITRQRLTTNARNGCDVTARAIAREVVKRMPRKTSEENAVIALKASRGLLDALIALLDSESIRTGRPYFINTSWILSDQLYREPLSTQPMRGLIVTAAGNESEEVLSARRDLGRWVADGRRMLAVGNLGSDGRLTRSSSRVEVGSEAFALRRFVAFSGRIPDTGPYRNGTSFSAPRVAWLLALASAIDPPIANWTTYGDRLWRNIQRSVEINTYDIPVFAPHLLFGKPF
jgi:hypothetical protein